jgi:hypothetical protein
MIIRKYRLIFLKYLVSTTIHSITILVPAFAPVPIVATMPAAVAMPAVGGVPAVNGMPAVAYVRAGCY